MTLGLLISTYHFQPFAPISKVSSSLHVLLCLQFNQFLLSASSVAQNQELPSTLESTIDDVSASLTTGY